jgi:hypothetical protein
MGSYYRTDDVIGVYWIVDPVANNFVCRIFCCLDPGAVRLAFSYATFGAWRLIAHIDDALQSKHKQLLSQPMLTSTSFGNNTGFTQTFGK